MSKNILLHLLLGFVTLCVQAQEQVSNPINTQFETLIQESNRYQDYKVVKSNALNTLKENTNKHIESLNAQIIALNQTINTQKEREKNLQTKLDQTNENLTIITEEKDSMQFFGMNVGKSLYNTILWSAIAILFAGMLYFLTQYKRSNHKTKEAKTNLMEVERELENTRRRSLEKEQKLGRQLQDERMKLSKLQGK